MVVMTSLLHCWWSGMSRVINRPAVLVAVSLIGCLMLWLASKQVKTTVQLLADLQLTGPNQTQQLPDKPRYFLFGALTLAFVWLDLLLLRWLFNWLVLAYNWSSERPGLKQYGAMNVAKPGAKPKPVKPLRKNPVRSCRILGRNYALL